VTLAGDDIAQEIESMGDRLAHYHISEPDLSDFEQPQCPHQAAAKALCDINYQGWRVIEMRQNKGDGLAAIKAAIEYCKRYYNF
jgi:sugar phosphate isomerase/epimerase